MAILASEALFMEYTLIGGHPLSLENFAIAPKIIILRQISTV